jgi:hypothetical protein
MRAVTQAITVRNQFGTHALCQKTYRFYLTLLQGIFGGHKDNQAHYTLHRTSADAYAVFQKTE